MVVMKFWYETIFLKCNYNLTVGINEALRFSFFFHYFHFKKITRQNLIDVDKKSVARVTRRKWKTKTARETKIREWNKKVEK